MGESTKLHHLIAYVQSGRVTDWKRKSLLMARSTGSRVLMYRSDSTGYFARHAGPGSVLWVIESHPHRPPSLAARLDIVGRIHANHRNEILGVEGLTGNAAWMIPRFNYPTKSEKRWYVVGGPSSRFFGYNDISTALLATRPCGTPPWKPGTTTWCTSYGSRLQQPRTIESGEHHLVDAAERLARRSLFVSWKHRDFRGDQSRIRDLAHELADAGLDCWWDHFALPPSRALERVRSDSDLLGDLLDDGLALSQAVLAIGSPHYGKPSLNYGKPSIEPDRNWTLGEWNRAKRRLVYDAWGSPCEGWPSTDFTPLPPDLDDVDWEQMLSTGGRRSATRGRRPPPRSSGERSEDRPEEP